MTVPFESSRLILSCWRVVAASPFWAMTDGVFWFPCAPGWTGDVEGSVPRLELLPLATAATPPSMTALPTARSIALKACSAPAVAILLVLAAAESGAASGRSGPCRPGGPGCICGASGDRADAGSPRRGALCGRDVRDHRAGGYATGRCQRRIGRGIGSRLIQQYRIQWVTAGTIVAVGQFVLGLGFLIVAFLPVCVLLVPVLFVSALPVGVILGGVPVRIAGTCRAGLGENAPGAGLGCLLAGRGGSGMCGHEGHRLVGMCPSLYVGLRGSVWVQSGVFG